MVVSHCPFSLAPGPVWTANQPLMMLRAALRSHLPYSMLELSVRMQEAHSDTSNLMSCVGYKLLSPKVVCTYSIRHDWITHPETVHSCPCTLLGEHCCLAQLVSLSRLCAAFPPSSESLPLAAPSAQSDLAELVEKLAFLKNVNVL